MGIMYCSKTDCENILCNYYSTEFGYICNDCLNELKKYQKKHTEMTLTDIKEWMNIPIDYENNKLKPLINLDEIFEAV